THDNSEPHHRSLRRKHCRAQGGCAFGVRVQVHKHQPRCKPSGLIISTKILSQVILTAPAIDRPDLGPDMFDEPLHDGFINYALRRSRYHKRLRHRVYLHQISKSASWRASTGRVRGSTASASVGPPRSSAAICSNLLAGETTVPSLPGSNRSTSSRPIPLSFKSSLECVLIIIWPPVRRCTRFSIWG